MCSFIGNQLRLTCSSNESEIFWSVTHPNIQTEIGLQPITTTGLNSTRQFYTSVGVFQFFRTSVSPLISELLVDNTTADLNGTEITCTRIDGTITEIINIIERGKKALVLL